MALLELERISAQYPGASTPVLADINLSLGPRQLLVALGPSGSGKTSLLNLIAVHYALRPADDDHRFGHGKAEALAGMVGIWGKVANPGQTLKHGDRLEIYRPLTVDPKVARRERFARQGARGAEHAAVAADHHDQVADLAEDLPRTGLQAMTGQHFGDGVLEDHVQVAIEEEFFQSANRIEHLRAAQTTYDADITKLLHEAPAGYVTGENDDYGRKHTIDKTLSALQHAMLAA